MPNNLSNPGVVNQILGEAKKVIEALRKKAYLLEEDSPE